MAGLAGEEGPECEAWHEVVFVTLSAFAAFVMHGLAFGEGPECEVGHGVVFVTLRAFAAFVMHSLAFGEGPECEVGYDVVLFALRASGKRHNCSLRGKVTINARASNQAPHFAAEKRIFWPKSIP